MTELGRSGNGQEIEATTDRLAGTRIEELYTELPDGIITFPLEGDGAYLALVAVVVGHVAELCD
jgi:hypothetical protein